MKHNIKITLILLSMFVVAQFIGLYVTSYYQSSEHNLPLGMETPRIEKNTDYYSFFSSIIFAFVIAVLLLFLLTKIKAEFLLKLWFFIVVIVALVISFNSIFSKLNYVIILSFILAIPLAYVKIYKKDFLIHNITELFIYPGIAAVFVPILNPITIILLLILISIYDMWAVWKSKIMQKMAKYQINELNIFTGFFVPHITKTVQNKIKNMKKSELKKKKFKVNVAILGGGDIVFSIITTGVMFKSFGFLPALFVLIGATLALSLLFFFSEKNKSYPAMPFITSGIFLGMIFGLII